MDLCDPMLECDALDLVFDPAISKDVFERNELAFWSVLANFERFLQAISERSSRAV
jgi:hypothetical protein